MAELGSWQRQPLEMKRLAMGLQVGASGQVWAEGLQDKQWCSLEAP